MCSVTKYSNIDFLIASHIKPWKNSTNEERIDPYNGLLLQPTIDKLFDSGYITFSERGDIIVSSFLTDYDIEKMNISRDMKLFKLHVNILPYLKYHRNSKFMS